METLPVELLSFVADHLQAWNTAAQPFSHLTETSMDGTVGWLTHLPSSRQDICNFRLVCSKFHSSSLRTFGEILGDHIFRWTKVGMEDLQALSDHKPLKPYIRTLTFGTAHFNDPADNYQLKAVLETLRKRDSERLFDAYSRAYKWQNDHAPDDCIDIMTIALGKLPMFKNLRFLIPDRPTAHLGGWLTSKQDAMRIRAELEIIGHPFDSIYEIDYGWDCPDHLIVPLEKVELSLETLRIGCGYGLHWSDLAGWVGHKSMSRLKHLRFDMNFDCFWSYTDVFKILRDVSPVESLSISYHHNPDYTSLTDATGGLIEYLRLCNNLKHIVIRGEWSYTEHDLLALVGDCEVLETLVLNDPILVQESSDSGENQTNLNSWASVVNRILSAPSDTLEHLQLSTIHTREATNRLVPTFNAVAWAEFIQDVRSSIEEQRTCTVYLSSGECEYMFCPSQAKLR